MILLNSNVEAHFSFTNALGLVSTEQARAIDTVTRLYPRAVWIVALHHHVVEYPTGARRRCPNASVPPLSTAAGSFAICAGSPAAPL